MKKTDKTDGPVTIPHDPDLDLVNVFKNSSLLAVVIFLFFGLSRLITMNGPVLIVNNIVAAGLVLVILKTYKPARHALHAQLLLTVTFLALVNINWILGGTSSPANYWLVADLLGAMFLLGRRETYFWTALIIAAFLGMFLLEQAGVVCPWAYPLSEAEYTRLHLLSFCGTFVMVMFFCLVYIRNTGRLLDRLDVSRHQLRDILSITHHDIISPLQVIKLHNEELKEQGRNENVRGIDEAVSTIESVLHSVRTINKIHSGDRILQFKEESTAALVNRAVLGCKPAAIRRKIKLNSNIPDGHTFVTDQGLFVDQVLKHLLSNVVRYAADGGSVSVSLEGNTLCVGTVNVPAGRLRILLGIVESGEARKVQKGMGFGLPVVKMGCRSLGIGLEVDDADNADKPENGDSPNGAGFTNAAPAAATASCVLLKLP